MKETGRGPLQDTILAPGPGLGNFSRGSQVSTATRRGRPPASKDAAVRP